jgi:Tol biopolymer transport system component
MSADRNSIVTARSDLHGGLWIADGSAREGTDIPQSVATGSLGLTGSLAWAGDRLLFSTVQQALYTISADGGAAEEFLKNATAPALTSDGKTLVYLSRREGSFDGALWKANADGRNPIQLVPEINFSPEITPDDQNVLFTQGAGAVQHIWSVPLAGGTPRLVSKLHAVVPKVSPDGKWLAFASLEAGDQWFISMCEMPECAAPRHVRAIDAIQFRIAWTPDGRAIAYAFAAPGANVWVHPLDGSPERQLTHFTDQRIPYDFAWSRDGKHFAVSRASTSQDIVLFRGLKPKS